MNKRNIIALLTFVTLGCISFISLGYEVNFGERINQISELKNSSPSKALAELSELETQLKQENINNQINYYKVKAEIYLDLGQYQDSKKASEKGLTLARDINSPSTITSELFYNLGFANESLGDIALAERHYLEGLEIAKSLEQQKQIALGLLNLGAIYYQTFQEDRSIVALQDALKISYLVNDDELSGSINSELGILYGQLGQTEKAIEFYEKSFEHFIKIKSYISAYNNMRNLGVNYTNVGNFEKSIESYQKIIDNQALIQSNEIILSAYSGLAWSYARKKGEENDEKAYKYLLEAGERIDKIEGSYLKLTYLIDRAWALDALKKYDEALDSLSDAEHMMATGNYSRGLQSALRIKSLQALIHYDLGLFKTAYKLLDHYSELELRHRNNQQTEKVTELRLAYESEQVDIENQILENKATIESIELAEASRVAKDKEKAIFVMAVVLLVFGWILYRIYRGQKILVHATRTDTLTGISNRRRLIELGEQFFEQARKDKQPFTILSIDCDHFKQINDQFGHHFGDIALTILAKTGQEIVREPNVYGRLSGEEFMVLLPNMNSEQSLEFAETFRHLIQKQQWNDASKMLTVSIGVATFDSALHQDFSELMKAADNKLYQAKREGRNRVCG